MRPLVLFVCLAALAGDALADTAYLSTGLTRGRSSGTAPAGCTLDASSTSATGGELAVGQRFGPALAVEFGYLSLGTLDLHGSCGLVPGLTLREPDSGVTLSGVGGFALAPRWRLYGRLGALRWSEGGAGGTEGVLGIGVVRELSGASSLAFEYRRIGSDVDALSLSVRFGF